MQDLTQGKVHVHIVQLSTFIALTTVFQTLYFIVDLYFVGRLGKEAIAGVGLAGNLAIVVLALTQTLGVGATSLVAQAIGRKDRAHAESAFNQALVMSACAAAAFGIVAFALRDQYFEWLAADGTTSALGARYLLWFIPALCLQFPLVVLSSVLRGLGDFKIPTAISIATVLMNIALAPVLMFGWGTGRPLGVAGAAIASLIAIFFGCIALALYMSRKVNHLRFRPDEWTPRLRVWWQMLRVGLPVGGEFGLMSVYLVLVYAIIRPFGAAAQAGFGIGVRVIQALFLPAVAIGFAAAPVAGQNFGARHGARVKQTFYSAVTMSAVVMLMLTLLCHIAPAAMVRVFNDDPAVVSFGAEYLRIVSWNFIATGTIFVTSSVFQGIGHTLPALASSAMRLVLFAVPSYWLSLQPGFQMRHVWYLSVASIVLQMVVSVLLLHREFGRKLVFTAPPAVRPSMPEPA